MLADFVERGLEKIGAVHAGNLDRILEREEQAFAGALFGIKLQQIVAEVIDRAAGHVVAVAPGQHRRERALAGAVRAHDGVDFARVDGEADALEDLFAFHAGVEVFNFENRFAHLNFKTV